MYHILRPLLVVALITQFATAGDSIVKHVPANAAGFVHIRTAEIARAPIFSPYASIARYVNKEIVELFDDEFGINIHDLTEVTWVIPSLASLESNSDIKGVVIFGFAEAFDADAVIESITDGWETHVKNGRTIRYDDETNTAFTLLSNQTFIIGSSDACKWFLTQKRAQGALTKTIHTASRQGHVTVGFNPTTIPASLKATVPPLFNAANNAHAVRFELTFRNTISASAAIQFARPEEAENSRKVFANLIEMGRQTIESEIANSQKVADRKDTFEAHLTSIFALGVGRFANDALVRLKPEVHGSTLVTSVELNDPGTLILTGLTAIQAIGQEANSSFEDIADELPTSEEE